jgi:hypothetical protein
MVAVVGRRARLLCCRYGVASVRSAKAIAADGTGCWSAAVRSIGISRDNSAADSCPSGSVDRDGCWASPSRCCFAARWPSLILAALARSKPELPSVYCYRRCCRKCWGPLGFLSEEAAPASFASCEGTHSGSDCCLGPRKESHRQEQKLCLPRRASRRT